MPVLEVDGRGVEVPAGATVLDAARRLGISVPAICHREGAAPAVSCMACVVEIEGRARLAPSCATPAEEGMRVRTDTEAARGARRTAIELLLGDHLGDCVAPCESACPARPRTPDALRRLGEGGRGAAWALWRERLLLPAVLGWICPGPCEKACRRADADAAVSVAALHRFAGEARLGEEAAEGEDPLAAPPSGTNGAVAVVGAGPAGLAAAVRLRGLGRGVTLYERTDAPGGGLGPALEENGGPAELLAREIGTLPLEGVLQRTGETIRGGAGLDALLAEHDAVLLATGEAEPSELAGWGLETTPRGVRIVRHTRATSRRGVFACGGVVRPDRTAVRSVAEGRAAAERIHEFLGGGTVPDPARAFTVRMGRLAPEEVERMLEGADPRPRGVEARGPALRPEAAAEEADRCLHCDCRARDACRLREASIACDALPDRHTGARPVFRPDRTHPAVLYEPGKCIACGLCVAAAHEAGGGEGWAMTGRGFDVRPDAPLVPSLAEALDTVALAAAEACPTGALARR